MGQRGVRHGVEVEIVENSPQADGRFHIEVVAGRRFEIVGGTWEQDGYAMATVRWILPPSLRPAPSAAAGPAPTGAATVTRDRYRGSESNGNASERGSIGENLADDADANTEDEGVADSDSALAGTGPASISARIDRDGERPSLDDATCIEMAAALGELVEEWKLLLSGRYERFHGQLGRSLADLGPMPPATDLDGTLHGTLPLAQSSPPPPPSQTHQSPWRRCGGAESLGRRIDQSAARARRRYGSPPPFVGRRGQPG
jgi:hypothetical protein